MPKVGKKAADSFPMEALYGGKQNLPDVIKLPVASEQQILQFRPADIRVPPRGCCGIETVKILFGDPAGLHEFIVLFSARNRREYIKGGRIGTQVAEHVNVAVNALNGILREADDVRKMAQHSMLAA